MAYPRFHIYCTGERPQSFKAFRIIAPNKNSSAITLGGVTNVQDFLAGRTLPHQSVQEAIQELCARGMVEVEVKGRYSNEPTQRGICGTGERQDS